MSNMSLEDMLLELAKYGRPKLNQFAVSATPGLASGGNWNVEVWVPSNAKWKEAQEKGLDVPTTGWRLGHTAKTPTEAASIALDKCIALAESPEGKYAKFESTDMVRGK